jgi:hypothetical protein
MSLKIRISKLCEIIIYIVLLLDLNLFMISKVSVASRMLYSIVLSAFVIIINLSKRKSIVYQNGIKWIRIYYIVVVFMLLAHYLHDSRMNGVSNVMFLRNSYYYLICIFSFALIYVIDINGGTEKLWNNLLAISILWTLILLVQAFVFNKTGRLLLPYLQQRGMYSNNTRNGMFRIEMRSVAHIMIIYCFDQLYNQRPKKKVVLLVGLLLGMITMFYVEQTRGYYIAIFLSIFAVMLYNSKNRKQFIRTSVLMTLGFVVLWRTKAIGKLFQSIFNGNDSMATGLVRVEGMKMFWQSFLSRPLWGCGFQETGDFVNSGLLSYYFNDCGFVGIIGQIGIWAFIIVGIMLFRFGFIVVRMLKKNSSDGSLLLGLYVFLVSSSTSLICYWNSTCFLWAIFEYTYAIFKLEKS